MPLKWLLEKDRQTTTNTRGDSMKYTREQIVESIKHWKNVLETSFKHTTYDINKDGKIRTVKDLKDVLSKFDDDCKLDFTKGDCIPGYKITQVWTDDQFREEFPYADDRKGICYIRVG